MTLGGDREFHRLCPATRADGFSGPGALGNIPVEPRAARGAITKTGNSHARRVLMEAAWNYRFPVRVSLAGAPGKPTTCGLSTTARAEFFIASETGIVLVSFWYGSGICCIGADFRNICYVSTLCLSADCDGHF